MLVEFRVKNFRSLRDEQVLSFVASKDKALLESNAIESGIKAAPRLLRSAVIYGANASGKSNIIKALQYMQRVLVKSATRLPGQNFRVQPFRLDSESSAKPTEFELTFILNGVRHQYGFAMTTERIVSEYLLVYKTAKPQCWFDRRYNTETGKYLYEFSTSLKGQKNVWEESTRSDALFLSMAVQLNSEQLTPVFGCLVGSIIIHNEHQLLGNELSFQMLETQAGKQRICEFLAAADTSITDIEVVPLKVKVKTVTLNLPSGKIADEDADGEMSELRFHHIASHGNATFDADGESSGTLKLLHFIGPVLNILDEGLTLVVDELETSLHPLLVQKLIELFHDPEINSKGAQLLFTTHNTSLLSAEGLFRRDQIWLVEKDQAQASTLYPLSDFSPRKGEAIERGYLSGRYGGIPFLKDLLGAR